MIEKCAVCGKETKVFTACSTCGGISFGYCHECLTEEREPYSALVGMGLYFDEISKEYKESVLLPSLKFYGKTPEEFDADVKKMDDDFYDWLQHQDDSVAYECEVEDFG